MTDGELVAAARHALAHLDDPQGLKLNAFAASHADLTYEAMRAAMLRALELLRAAGSGAAADRARREHAILARCDLAGESHKCVAGGLGLSRRQFYRERRAALQRLGAAIAGQLEVAGSRIATLDLGDAAEACIEALRSAGEHRSVFREASALATVVAGEAREVEAWMVAAEAARFLADGGAAVHALGRARDATSDRDAAWCAIWIASGEMNLQWVNGDCSGARATLDGLLRRGAVPERALHGKEAILMGITLAYAAAIELDCGRFDTARSLLARATQLTRREVTPARRQSLLRLSAVLLRLSALLALHDGDDRGRSLAEQHAALDAARATGQLGNVAMSAVHYAAGLAREDGADAIRYAEYGLNLARRFYPGDRLSELTLVATPVLLRGRGVERAAEAVSDARRDGIGKRDELFLALAETKIAVAGGGTLRRAAAERAEDLSGEFFRRGIDAWAWDAQLLTIEACARLGYRPRARRRLAEIGGGMAGARVETRVRARTLGTLLALPA
ncbi:MAG TPA: hypothetical protein VGF86_01265 [Candidatus Tumulicola sp.]